MSISKSFKLPKNSSCAVILNCRSWFLRESGVSKLGRDIKKVIFGLCYSTMESNILDPPGNLHGMKVLDKEAFNKTVTLLSLEIESHKISKLNNALKKYLIRMKNFKSIQDTNKECIKKVIFDPAKIRKRTDFNESIQKLFETLEIKDDNFSEINVNFSYDNWFHTEILKAILPKDEPLSSFSIIGHIVHVNLKGHLLDYKSIIGQVLFDKIPNIRTVVNKTTRIDNVYRNFEMELLCGEPDYIACVKENGMSFKFDFSKVYWNPRLNSEHGRVVESLKVKDVLFDVFCGVGPFSIPAAKKKCTVYANDLNPESIQWLRENLKLNKVSEDYIQIYNMDGSDFIMNEIKNKMISIWKDDFFLYKIHVVMNLPALALDFLKYFKGLFTLEMNDISKCVIEKNLPIVHCYFFAQNSETNNLKEMIEQRSDINLNNIKHDICFVRDVSSIKSMFKIELVLPLEYICYDKGLDNKEESLLDGEPKAKKICTSD